eukprot:TRINITY_DN2421_c0_g1_i2.p1 TRINITY_DN2421_c0_g1~~TRINITY_DN2421_c0_g1_i2.p1  ORF type:complete len:414 (-),score=159.61 TRINITY_DN2421_c0_g1_i2:267-1508(-)
MITSAVGSVVGEETMNEVTNLANQAVESTKKMANDTWESAQSGELVTQVEQLGMKITTNSLDALETVGKTAMGVIATETTKPDTGAPTYKLKPLPKNFMEILPTMKSVEIKDGDESMEPDDDNDDTATNNNTNDDESPNPESNAVDTEDAQDVSSNDVEPVLVETTEFHGDVNFEEYYDFLGRDEVQVIERMATEANFMVRKLTAKVTSVDREPLDEILAEIEELLEIEEQLEEEDQHFDSSQQIREETDHGKQLASLITQADEQTKSMVLQFAILAKEQELGNDDSSQFISELQKQCVRSLTQFTKSVVDQMAKCARVCSLARPMQGSSQTAGMTEEEINDQIAESTDGVRNSHHPLHFSFNSLSLSSTTGYRQYPPDLPFSSLLTFSSCLSRFDGRRSPRQIVEIDHLVCF